MRCQITICERKRWKIIIKPIDVVNSLWQKVDNTLVQKQFVVAVKMINWYEYWIALTNMALKKYSHLTVHL